MAADEGSVQKAASGVKTAGDISDVAAVREQDVKEREAGVKSPASFAQQEDEDFDAMLEDALAEFSK